jgi:hypothetical protein
VEPNVTFTPDGKWIVFSGNFHSRPGAGRATTHTYAVEIAPAKPALPPPGRSSRSAPAPRFRDPGHDGAADATMVWNRAEQHWRMLHPNRRADADDEQGVPWVHGTDIGIASTPDAGATWNHRGIARGRESETDGTRTTFRAPEVVDCGGQDHAFLSCARGVPDTGKGARDILRYTSAPLVDEAR